MNTTQRLFVYGTLLQSHDNPYARLLRANARYLADGIFQGKLYQVDVYPGVLSSADPSHQVHGQVYEFDKANADQVLIQLDAYEGIGPDFSWPHEYVRESASIHCGEKTYTCWVYLYNRRVAEHQWIASGRFI
ncbi:hypothetical protein BFP72_06495 [Reichenbachiella sp. 5M10]|uniref:gamma-glutamylcyclotransferase family protein n=1 Tax=Reichenbachiella sp. 5M10 TaxID=1889772 RepID=UPI000C162780|nr:gamma-glutamylcyclotransferase family protein [Reichenbachiella sp. 5M10]PIB35069.1 hypothetical protein BFP72_06495 [Reichenbachiella sp. 5M10]